MYSSNVERSEAWKTPWLVMWRTQKDWRVDLGQLCSFHIRKQLLSHSYCGKSKDKGVTRRQTTETREARAAVVFSEIVSESWNRSQESSKEKKTHVRPRRRPFTHDALRHLTQTCFQSRLTRVEMKPLTPAASVRGSFHRSTTES